MAHIVAAAVLVGVLSAGPPSRKSLAREYRVLLMQLQGLPRKHSQITLPPAKRPGPRISRPVHAIPLSARAAPQTLVVPDAIPDLVLQKAIPLPLAPPEPKGALPLPMLSVMPAARADILSLPDEPVQATGALVVPKVNQLASGSGGGSAPVAGDASGEKAGEIAGEKAGANAEAQLSETGVTRLELPPDGRFPTRVLGPSVSENYPDLTTNLAGKVVSTVYLKVGLRKSWTLEFWAAGSPPPDAPWAYQIFRPENLHLPEDTEVVLIGGTINTDGRFDHLQLLLPPEWAEKETLFRLLRRWTFRPAMRDQTAIGVDILLSIPQNDDDH